MMPYRTPSPPEPRQRKFWTPARQGVAIGTLAGIPGSLVVHRFAGGLLSHLPLDVRVFIALVSFVFYALMLRVAVRSS